MKLKFSIEPKDVIILLVFAIVWLFIDSLLVANVGAFINGEGFTFNFLLAFYPNYIAATILVFLAGIIAVLAGLKSIIFERDEDSTGIGLSIQQKREKNYSRWAKEKEMKSELKPVSPASENSEYAGIPLMNDGKTIWVDNGSYHNLIIGSTGSGKTEMLVQPMVKVLAKKGESMIITDPKGEIYENNANELRERGYDIVLLNFRDPQKGNCWNPLSLPYNLYKTGNSDKAIELLDDLAKNILYDESSKGQDPFWENTSADYFSGLALGLFDDAIADEINLNSINYMTTVGEDKLANTTYIKEYFSYKDPTSPAYINASGTLMAPSETKGSILSVFKQKIKLFSSRENLSEMLSKSDFDMENIGRKKTAVFIVIQDEKKTYHPLVTIFIKQCYETLIRVAQENGGKLKFRTNFILDEFANMPPLKDVTTMVTAARSRLIRFSFIIQNFAQLNEVYGKENAETIKGNCGNIVYLISSELAALEEISKMCGEQKSKEKEKTTSTPLVSVSDLQRLKLWTIIVLRIRMMPFKTVLKPNFEMEQEKLWGKSYQKAPYPERTKDPVEIFELKKFVDKKREEKLNKMLEGNGNNSMPSSSFPSSPFPPSSPFGGAIPPFMPSPSNNSNSFDVDDLVKRIDAKIAELEEEERQEQLKEEQNKRNLENANINNVENQVKEENKIETTALESKNTITDDQFFDDFFFDE